MAKRFLPLATAVLFIAGCAISPRQEQAQRPYGFVVTDTGLSDIGAAKLPELLASIGLPDLADFEEVAGPRKFDRALCETVRQKFVELLDSPVEADPCARAAQQANIASDSIPISFSINESASQNLVLQIKDRQGKETFFTFHYHIPSGTLDAE